MMGCNNMMMMNMMIMNNNNMTMMAAANNTNYHRPAAITARSNRNHGRPRINNRNRESITNNTNRDEPPVRSQIVSSAPDDIVYGLMSSIAFALLYMLLFDALSIWIFQSYIDWPYIIFYCVDALMIVMLFIYVCSACCIRPKLGILKVGFIITGIFFILHLASITTVGIMCSKTVEVKHVGCYTALMFPGFNVFFMLFVVIALYVIISKYQVSKKATNSRENNNNAPTENNDNQTV